MIWMGIFCILLAFGSVLLVYGYAEKNTRMAMIGVIFIASSIIIAITADGAEKPDTKNNCVKINGRLVEYRTEYWDIGSKQTKENIELFCLKGNQLSK